MLQVHLLYGCIAEELIINEDIVINAVGSAPSMACAKGKDAAIANHVGIAAGCDEIAVPPDEAAKISVATAPPCAD